MEDPSECSEVYHITLTCPEKRSFDCWNIAMDEHITHCIFQNATVIRVTSEVDERLKRRYAIQTIYILRISHEKTDSSVTQQWGLHAGYQDLHNKTS